MFLPIATQIRQRNYITSLRVNGKQPWRGNLKERYQQFVNISANTPEGISHLYGSSLVNSKDLPSRRPLLDRSGAEKWTRTPYAIFVAADFKSLRSASPSGVCPRRREFSS